MKDLIIAVSEAGLTQTIYDGFQVLTFIIIFFVILWYSKKIGIQAWKAVAIVLVVYPLSDFWKRVMYWMESGFQHFGGENNVRIFIWVPVVAYLVAKIIKLDYRKMCQLLAPCVVLTQGVGHFGCLFPGCCHGYLADWGVYNLSTGKYHFPVQIFEAVTALAITAYILIRSKRKNHVADGKEYPIMLILFGYTRFIWEFFRDNEKLVLGISNLAFHALFAGIVGTVMLVYVICKEKKQTAVITE